MGYSALKAKSRSKLRAMSKQKLPDGDDSTDYEDALHRNDLRAYQPAYAFTDIDKVLPAWILGRCTLRGL